ncbi:hypothetical protein ACFW04_011497 [Cataglyphis niger]
MDEQEDEDHFVRTHSRDASGRFVVRLPLRLPLPDAGTKRTAARLLGHMERRFARDDQLMQLYTDFMRQYEVLGHMSPVQLVGAAGLADCYLPHHGVMRKGSSAKIQVVFNSSSTVPSGASLDRHLKVGSNLLPALEDVLLRWRVHRFVLASDIEKMYRQILVAAEDRHLQRILWRHEDQTAPKTFELNTVTYGLVCAPFLAVRSATTRRRRGGPLPRRISCSAPRRLRGRHPHGCTLHRGGHRPPAAAEGAVHGGQVSAKEWSANESCLLARIALEHRTQRDLLSWTPQESHATLGLH